MKFIVVIIGLFLATIAHSKTVMLHVNVLQNDFTVERVWLIDRNINLQQETAQSPHYILLEAVDGDGNVLYEQKIHMPSCEQDMTHIEPETCQAQQHSLMMRFAFQRKMQYVNLYQVNLAESESKNQVLSVPLHALK